MFGNTLGAKSTTSSPAPTAATHNPNRDTEVQEVAADGISSVRFSPSANHLAATSWDCTIRVWEISTAAGSYFAGSNSSTLQSNPKAMQTHTEPLLCSAFHRDGSGLFFGSTDGQVRYWDFNSNQVQQVAQHERGVKECFFLKEQGYLVSGSWDKRICYWDCRSPNPIHTQPLEERVYSMDAKGNMLVVGTANRHVKVYDLRNPANHRVALDSPLKWQTRCVSCFNDEKGFLIGSIEGRVGIQHCESSSANKNFTFKCHRQGEQRSGQEVYAVNAIVVHPTYGTFATCGSDGAFHFWDKESKRRLKAMDRGNESIPCACFNADGSIFAYAVSYDWRLGVEAYNPDIMRSHILLHSIVDGEVRPQASGMGSRRR